jgi:hypothetical protein
MHIHALAGFFNELVNMRSPQVKEILQRWGIYFRSLPLEEEAQQ